MRTCRIADQASELDARRHLRPSNRTHVIRGCEGCHDPVAQADRDPKGDFLTARRTRECRSRHPIRCQEPGETKKHPALSRVRCLIVWPLASGRHDDIRKGKGFQPHDTATDWTAARPAPTGPPRRDRADGQPATSAAPTAGATLGRGGIAPSAWRRQPGLRPIRARRPGSAHWCPSVRPASSR